MHEPTSYRAFIDFNRAKIKAVCLSVCLSVGQKSFKIFQVNYDNTVSCLKNKLSMARQILAAVKRTETKMLDMYSGKTGRVAPIEPFVFQTESSANL